MEIIFIVGAQIDGLPKFDEVMISSRSIYFSWSLPYFPLRTYLLYGQSDDQTTAVQLANGARNHTIDSLGMNNLCEEKLLKIMA